MQADEVLRRSKDRDERLKAAQAEAATLNAEAKRLEQQRAQLEAELAETHRERLSAVCLCHSESESGDSSGHVCFQDCFIVYCAP